MLRVCVQGTIASTTIKFLVDTGAAVSLLSSKIWREIENTRVPIVMQPWLGEKLVGVNGTPLSVRGCIHAPLCIGGTQFNGSFVIASDLWVEAIVGLDLGHISVLLTALITLLASNQQMCP